MSATAAKTGMRKSLWSAITTPVVGPFVLATGAGVGFYVVVLLSYAAVHLTALPRTLALDRVMTVVAVIGLAAHLVTAIRVVRHGDEYIRAVAFKRLTVGALATLGGATIWGLLANVGWAAPLDPIFLYGLFALVNLGVLYFVNADRP